MVFLRVIATLERKSIVITDAGLLFIEPRNAPSRQPVIDEFTVKIVGALREAEAGAFFNDQFFPGVSSKGKHFCSCGAASTAQDYRLAGGEVTNSLAGHYMAWHRSEVPQSQLDRVENLPNSEIEPTVKELVMPHAHQ